jgi:pyruvate/2-oxoglutarate dehydrogenase complex dihydrolipoamide acyltransferase (E2) component
MGTVSAPMQGTIVTIDVEAGQLVRAGQQLMLIESMKMHHSIDASEDGRVDTIVVTVGQTVMAGEAVVTLSAAEVEAAAVEESAAIDPSSVRPDLAESVARHAMGLDENRAAAVARRRKVGRRTARENVADLVDKDSFVEYGPVVIAAQRRRRSVEELIEKTPADGMIGGIGTVNGDVFSGRAAQVVAVSYDYTVLAGTQGTQNHRKKDRLFELAETMRLPVVFFTEGGGGRPATRTGSASAASTASRSCTWVSSAVSCRSSASTRATASPATPRSSAAATSSSRQRTRTSAWAVRR